jgi:hypothetical protein
MAAPGINLVETRFPVSVPKPKAPVENPTSRTLSTVSIGALMGMGMSCRMVLRLFRMQLDHAD